VDGPQTFEAMHSLIAGAKSTIEFEHYYFAPDEIGRGFVDAMAEAARRGVKVRVLIDWIGARMGTAKALQEVVRAGGEVRMFNRPGFRRWMGFIPRDHRKLIVVDKRVGITGGVGIGAEWAHRLKPHRTAPWRDTAVEIRGPAATDMVRAFLVMWNRAIGKRLTREERRARLAPTGTQLDSAREPAALVGIVEGEPGRARVARALQLAAVGAERSIWIASAYFIPSPREVESLTGAARDGVDVRLLLPNSNDHPWVTRLSRRYYKYLLRGGVRIWEWGGLMMHAKSSVTDSRVTRVGSTDFNPLGVAVNFELDAFIDDQTLGNAAERQFLMDLELSKEVTKVGGRIRQV